MTMHCNCDYTVCTCLRLCLCAISRSRNTNMPPVVVLFSNVISRCPWTCPSPCPPDLRWPSILYQCMDGHGYYTLRYLTLLCGSAVLSTGLRRELTQTTFLSHSSATYFPIATARCLIQSSLSWLCPKLTGTKRTPPTPPFISLSFFFFGFFAFNKVQTMARTHGGLARVCICALAWCRQCPSRRTLITTV